MIRKGDLEPIKLRICGLSVKKVYKGSTLIWALPSAVFLDWRKFGIANFVPSAGITYTSSMNGGVVSQAAGSSPALVPNNVGATGNSVLTIPQISSWLLPLAQLLVMAINSRHSNEPQQYTKEMTFLVGGTPTPYLSSIEVYPIENNTDVTCWAYISIPDGLMIISITDTDSHFDELEQLMVPGTYDPVAFIGDLINVTFTITSV